MDKMLFKKIYNLFQIPICVISFDKKNVFTLPKDIATSCPFIVDTPFRDTVLNISKDTDLPFIFLENESVHYGVIPYDQHYVILGPVSQKETSNTDLSNYKHAHRLKSDAIIYKCSIATMQKILSLVIYIISGISVDASDIYLKSADSSIFSWDDLNDLENYQLEQSEEERFHNTKDYETKILSIVEQGDVDGLKEFINTYSVDMDRVGVVAEDERKQAEYLVVAFITLMCRAAIHGGLNPENAYELADIYMQRIAKSKSLSDIQLIGLKAQAEFTARVNESNIRKSRLLYIEACKDYIAKHLRQPFKVDEISQAIGVNRSYLSRKFTESEGITIQQYIMKERCEHAANLLRYSEYSISIIAEYFCFSSQSHFGIQFKKYLGMTPAEYRKKYHYISTS